MKKALLFLILLISLSGYSQDTYKIGETEYYYNEYYTTGHPKVKRNETNKKNFLESKGLSSTPEGYEIDHIKPLSEGGTDSPENMQLISIEEHRSKTSYERYKRSKINYYQNSTPIQQYSQQSSYSYPRKTSASSSSKTIHTGPRGGKYYINSKGNKTYVKKK